jgi:hypothetical protein
MRMDLIEGLLFSAWVILSGLWVAAVLVARLSRTPTRYGLVCPCIGLLPLLPGRPLSSWGSDWSACG